MNIIQIVTFEYNSTEDVYVKAGLLVFAKNEKPLDQEQMRSDCMHVTEWMLLAVYPVPQLASRWYSTVGLRRKRDCSVLVCKKDRRLRIILTITRSVDKACLRGFVKNCCTSPQCIFVTVTIY